ncbi:MAG: hypothetical protein ABIF87_01980 [Pseudomonadota bacterium]
MAQVTTPLTSADMKHARNPLPYYKLKGKILVKRSEFEQWLDGFKVNQKENIRAVVDDIMNGLKRGESER